MQRYQTVPQLFITMVENGCSVPKIEDVLQVVGNHGHGYMEIDNEIYEITWQGQEQVSVRAVASPNPHQIFFTAYKSTCPECGNPNKPNHICM